MQHSEHAQLLKEECGMSDDVLRWEKNIGNWKMFQQHKAVTALDEWRNRQATEQVKPTKQI